MRKIHAWGTERRKRPADVIGAAVMVAKIAAGEVEDTSEDDGKDPALRRSGPRALRHERSG